MNEWPFIHAGLKQVAGGVITNLHLFDSYSVHTTRGQVIRHEALVRKCNCMLNLFILRKEMFTADCIMFWVTTRVCVLFVLQFPFQCKWQHQGSNKDSSLLWFVSQPLWDAVENFTSIISVNFINWCSV